MQTYCPYCETHFRITESQIDIADGYVRCGICEEVFNVYEVADNSSLEDEQQPLLSDIDNTTDNIDEYQSDTRDLNHEETSNLNHEALPDDDPIESEEVNDNDEKSDDFFNEETNESLHHVVPEDLRSYKPPSVTATALWSIGILLLISSLAIEYIWFNHNQFHQFPELQAGIEKLCQYLDCKRLSRRDPSKIELITRNVYSHPNEKDALMVSMIIKNNASFTQPYPVIQIDFSDIRGSIVAARRFFPIEYLATRDQQSEPEQPSLLQPDASTSVILEIKDPGKDAMAYEFNFL